MPNHRILAADLRKEFAQGAPDGLDEQYWLRAIPLLFNRIEELEKIMDTFAHTGNRILTKSESAELVQVRAKDCVDAFRVMDGANAIPQKKKEIFYPALG